MTGTGYAPHPTVQNSQEPVAIVAVDTGTKMVKGLTRVRVIINIDCSLPVGGMYVLPAVGEQWYVERFNDRNWKLVTRLPFNDDNTLIEPQPGQMIIGGTGPVELNGSHVNVHGDINIDGNLNGGNVVSGSANGVPTALTLWTGTSAQFDAIPTPRDPNTVYVVVPS